MSMYKKGIFAAVSLVITTSAFFSGTPVVKAAKINGAKLYSKHCDTCHDKNGKPTDLGKELGTNDFTDKSWQASVTDEKLIEQIRNGTPEKMMPFKEELSQDEIKSLIPVIRGFAKK